MDTLNTWIAHYGYFGIYALLVFGIIGLPIPDETIITLTGYLVYKGELNPVFAFLSALLGSMTGISVSYILGKTFGNYIFSRFGKYIHLTEDRLSKAHDWFKRIGKWALTFGYFIPGVRHIIAIIAGTSKLELWEFMLFAYTGSIIWVSAFFCIGYFFGEKWDKVLETIEHHIIIVSVIAGILLILFLIFRRKIFKKDEVIPKVDE